MKCFRPLSEIRGYEYLLWIEVSWVNRNGRRIGGDDRIDSVGGEVVVERYWLKEYQKERAETKFWIS